MEGYLLVLPALGAWALLLLVPWRPWRNREVLEAHGAATGTDLAEVTVLIPARNEAAAIGTTLAALAVQGKGLRVLVVDDESDDGTAQEVAKASGVEVSLRRGAPLPAGWAGKVWALEQGLGQVETPITLLLDADIELRPGMVGALRDKMRGEGLQFVSLMASLRMESFWERLLMPAFVYYFRLIYPFALANNPRARRFAAAAGGCIMVETAALREIGGFQAIRDALIDDCSLAARIKQGGFRTWVGVTRSVLSRRRYQGLGEIWSMVARSAYTQLRNSSGLLLVVTGLFIMVYWLPVAGLFAADGATQLMAALALVLMMVSYLPTLTFYGMSPAWALALPLVATLYLAMTWSSATRHWLGRPIPWRGRRGGKA